MAKSVEKMVLSWSLGHFHGWGVYGLNLIFAMLRRNIVPQLLHAPGALQLDPLQARLLLGVLEGSADGLRFRARHPDRILRAADTLPLIHSDGQLHFADPKFIGKPPVGVTFFETAQLHPQRIQAAANMALVVVGSSWNYRILKEKYHLPNVRFVMQGVETTLFYPSGRRELLRDRFVVFSGGKLEFRKGQDIVLETFRRFHARHPEALLLSCWSNRWVDPLSRFSSRWVEGFPQEGEEGLASWMGKHLPQGSFFDMGLVANPMMPAMLREADVALFPNRCEGGTNLVAMECMAAGVPVILSANTGHMDLADETCCLLLKEQTPVVSPHSGEVLEDWGESSVEEALDGLERVYGDRNQAAWRAKNSHGFMAEHSWRHQCDEFLDVVLQNV